MLRFMGRSVGLTFLAIGIALAFATAIALILIQLLGGQDFIDDVSCRLGLSTDCIREELASERRRLAEMQTRLGQLQAVYDRLARLEHASESFAIFYTDHSGQYPVTTGHRYASLIEPGTFVAGWCYIDLPGPGSVSVNFYLARMDAGRTLMPEVVSDDALGRADLSRTEVVAARHRCQWPDGSA